MVHMVAIIEEQLCNNSLLFLKIKSLKKKKKKILDQYLKSLDLLI